MRNLKSPIITFGLIATVYSAGSHAQFLDALKDTASDLVQQAEQKQAIDALKAKAGDLAQQAELTDASDLLKGTTNNPIQQTKQPEASGSQVSNQAKKSSSAGQPALESGPGNNLISFTKCAGLSLSNIMTGELGNYTFQQGFSQEKRGGMINRKPGKVNKGCILPSIYSHQVIYLEVDTKSYEALGNSNNWEMQCVKSASPSAGVVGKSEPKTEYPYKVNWLSGKDVMLHCGHNEKHVEACAEGSNSSRSGQYKKLLQARGKTMLSIYGTASTLAPAHGEKLYCQYYNKPSGKSLFAFEYLRTRS